MYRYGDEVDENFEEWDIDSCYNELEPSEHWVLKRAFLEKHYKKYNKYRLLALANTFYNMEFMGARYNPKIECLISELTKEVPEIIDYREGRKSTLKRTFVSASDVSRNKIQRTQIDIPVVSQPLRTQFKKSTDVSNKELIDKVRQQNGYRGKLVLFEHSNSLPYQIISESTQKAQLELILRRTGKHKGELTEFELLIDKESIATDFAESEKKAKEIIGKKVLNILKETCFTIVTKTHLEGESLNKSDTAETKPEPKSEELIPSENKGAKIMRLMGWKGQGLGKNSDGIQKPIEVTENISRLGLNLGNDKGYKILRDKITEMLEEYIRNESTHNIVFSNEFSNEERKIVHGIAQKLKLKSKSYGKDTNRQLVVSRKLSTWELVEHLLKNNYSTPNYELKKPTKFL